MIARRLLALALSCTLLGCIQVNLTSSEPQVAQVAVAKVSYEAFLELVALQAYEAVVAALGGEGEELRREVTADGHTFVVYAWSAPNAQRIVLIFRNNLLVAKDQEFRREEPVVSYSAPSWNGIIPEMIMAAVTWEPVGSATPIPTVSEEPVATSTITPAPSPAPTPTPKPASTLTPEPTPKPTSMPTAAPVSTSGCGPGQIWVSGYYRKNGTYVRGYCRSR